MLPETVAVIFVAMVLTVTAEATAMVPSTESLFVQYKLELGSGGSVVVLNEPLTGALKSMKVSPATRLVEPILFTAKVAPALRVPAGAVNRSLFVTAARSIFIVTAPAIVAVPLIVRVPREAVSAPRVTSLIQTRTAAGKQAVS